MVRSTRPAQSARAVLLVAAFAGLGVGAAAQQATGDGITATTIQIGVESAVGSLSLDGENLGFVVAFEEANAEGGVHGRRFVWTERRRASGAPADVLAVARTMTDEDRVFAVVNFSGPAIADIAVRTVLRLRQEDAKMERHRLPTLLQPANSTGPAASNVVALKKEV